MLELSVLQTDSHAVYPQLIDFTILRCKMYFRFLMSSKQPLLLDDEGPRRAPDSDDENNAGAVGGATGGQRATGGATTQMNDDFLRVNLPPPSSQQSSVPYPQQQQPTQQKPQGQSQLNTTAARPQPVPGNLYLYNIFYRPPQYGILTILRAGEGVEMAIRYMTTRGA